MFGAGTAGIGIADQLRDAMVRDGLPVAEAMRRFWCVGRHGLCTTDMASSLRDFQLPYARPGGEIGGWSREESGGFGLAEVVRQVKPTMLIGTSTVGGAFTEAIVRGMAAQVERPIIFPLTNPTAQSEAVPADLLAWTEGRAVIATGSPFDPVSYAGKTYPIAQANNALVFPGLGLGTIVTRARTVSDGMLAAAAAAVAALTDPSAAETAILPAVENLRPLSAAVAGAVARAAIEEGLAGVRPADLEGEIQRTMWQPVYRPVVAA
jgi:malate dehydrogenase (oxaloacetate-decarboxylating)